MAPRGAKPGHPTVGDAGLRTKAAFLFFRCGAPRDPARPIATATAHSRIQLADASRKPVAAPDRDAFFKDVAAELGRHEVVGPGLLHRIISDVQRRYDIADQRRSTG
jgi:hypothetical protein